MLSKKENPAVRAMQLLQKQMKHEAEETGLVSEERIMDAVKEVRAEKEKEHLKSGLYNSKFGK